MKDRRQFLRYVWELWAGLSVLPLVVGCGRESDPAGSRRARGIRFVPGEVTLYDTYAMALYLDGSLGPKTGVVKVQYILDGNDLTLDFWHGHGGKQHRFTLTSAVYQDLKALKRVTIETTAVDGHKHKLFIDPKDSRYRVPGAQPIPVPV